MIFVEFGDRGFEDKIAACDLKLLHKVGRPGEQNAPIAGEWLRRKFMNNLI
jgi:hypothetical protein